MSKTLRRHTPNLANAKTGDMALNLSKLMVALSGTIFLSVLNGTMFNVALPTIAREFTLSPVEVSWVVVGYIAVFAFGAAAYGKLADLYPVRRLLPLGLGLFTLGSILGFVSTSYPLLVAGRLIQAAGGAAVPALAMIVTTRYFEPHRRGRALGLIASTVAFASGIGPIAGGLITQYLGWHYLFPVSLLALIALPFIVRNLPREDRPRGSFDVPGAALLAAGVATLLLGINLNPWFLAVSAIAFYFFKRRIQQTPHPFVRVDLLQNDTYRSLLLIGFVVFFSVLGSFFILPLMLADLNGLQANLIGLVLFPGAITAAFLGTAAGRLADRAGNEVVIRGALYLMVFGFWALSTFVGGSPVVIALLFVFVYVGMAGIQASLANFVAGTLPPAETGVGMGLFNLTVFMGGAFGPALAGRFLAFGGGTDLNPLSQAAQHGYSNSFLLLGFLAVFNLLLLARIGRGRHPLHNA